MRILITGITGFVGGHLTETLRAEDGHAIVGLSRSADWLGPWAHLRSSAKLYAAELIDGPRIEAVLRDTRPDWIFHLAGYANPRKSFQEPDLCWSDNLAGTRSLYDAIHRSGLRPRILFVSTGLVYGDPLEAEQECDERAELRPTSPYAASKAAADLLSYQYALTPGLDIVRVRLFNQIGPRQPAEYATANWARQIASAEAGRQSPVVETWDLTAGRDLTDVRDMVAALRGLIEHGQSGEVYNAGRGRTWRMQEVLDRLVAQSRVQVEIRTRSEPGRLGHAGVIRANAQKLRAATGWEPRYDLDRSLADILDYWRGISATS